jgi:hypothetical protein
MSEISTLNRYRATSDKVSCYIVGHVTFLDLVQQIRGVENSELQNWLERPKLPLNVLSQLHRLCEVPTALKTVRQIFTKIRFFDFIRKFLRNEDRYRKNEKTPFGLEPWLASVKVLMTSFKPSLPGPPVKNYHFGEK